MKTKNKKGSIGLRTAFEVVLVVFAAGSVFWGAYFMVAKIMDDKPAINQSDLKNKALENASDDGGVPDGANPIKSLETDKNIIKKGQIDWQDPVDIGNIGLTTQKIYEGCDYNKCDKEGVGSSGVKYVKAGTVSEGAYAGFDLIVVSAEVYEGPSSHQFFHLLKKDDQITFISIDEYTKSLIESYFSDGGSKRNFDDKVVISELIFPDDLQGENERQRFVKDQYAVAFFVDAKLKKAFVHPQYGQVWMTDGAKASDVDPTVFELNSYIDYSGKKTYHDIFGRQGFYLRAPDGTAVTYKFVPDIFADQEDARYAVLNATWNSGEKNSQEFERNPSGCGSSRYVYDETLEVNPENDLTVIGKTDKGDDLYGYRNASSAGFSTLYNETYWVKDGEKKKSPEEFLKDFPKVFWRDPFGRVLAFYNTKFISPAECGKPVIYLYPEKPMDVSVKVEPGKGLSFTDPEYKDGWKVLADEKGNLTNLSDGKKYPYLFWEGAGDVYYEMPEQGFVVKNENLETFFDGKLAKLGLIQKESNDFKEFWVAKMRETRKPYYLVTFLSRQFIDQLAPLKIDPRPDTIIRVLMDWKGLDKHQKAYEFPIRTPERKGFTVVEWGGMLK